MSDDIDAEYYQNMRKSYNFSVPNVDNGMARG